ARCLSSIALSCRLHGSFVGSQEMVAQPSWLWGSTGILPVESRTRTNSPLHVIMRRDRNGGQNPAHATLDGSARARHSRHAALDSLDRHRRWTLGSKALTISNYPLLRFQGAHCPTNVLPISKARARPSCPLLACVSPFSLLRRDHPRSSLFAYRRFPAVRDKISSP